MARNEEKHSGRLNRLWLQQLDEEHAKKNPKRPGLGSLHTAQDVKKWMPSIKKDIDFYLMQSQVGCYPDRKIAEFSEEINSLTREYKAYVRKYRELDGGSSSTPWTEAPYRRKHKTQTNSDIPEKVKKNSDVSDKSATCSYSPLSLPVLDNEESYKEQYGYEMVNKTETTLLDSDDTSHDLPLQFDWKTENNIGSQDHIIVSAFNPEMQDKPLCFEQKNVKNLPENSNDCDKIHACRKSSALPECENQRLLADHISDSKCENQCSLNISCTQRIEGKKCSCERGNNSKYMTHTQPCERLSQELEINSSARSNVLNIPYSDSSSDENT